MKLEVIRKEFSDVSTLGEMLIDGENFSYTLEDAVRPEGIKIPGKTAIPYGSYDVVINYSNRFKRMMPLIQNVPNFEGVRIHSGNTDKDTEGCLLLGFTKQKDFIGQSKLAFTAFFQRLEKGLKEGKVRIEIKNENS